MDSDTEKIFGELFYADAGTLGTPLKSPAYIARELEDDGIFVFLKFLSFSSFIVFDITKVVNLDVFFAFAYELSVFFKLDWIVCSFFCNGLLRAIFFRCIQLMCPLGTVCGKFSMGA